MRDKLFAICDRDEQYLQGIQDYLLRKKLAEFEILIFTTPEQALAYSRNRHFEILLIGEEVYTPCVEEIQADKVYLLWENGKSGVTKYPLIAKYQSMAQILARIMEDYAGDSISADTLCHMGNRTRLLCFYSPDRTDAQTLAALTAGEILAQRGEKTLYLNLRAFAGFAMLLNTVYEADITDYLYFALKHSDRSVYKLESIKKTIGGLDYLPPALDYGDMLQLTETDWKKVLDTLVSSGNYDTIVVDLSEICQGFYTLLALSEKIYYIQGNTRHAKAMEEQYERLLTIRGEQNILNKTQKIDLPGWWEQQSYEYTCLAASGMGEFIKHFV